MAKITLDSLRESINKKYANFDIDLGDGVEVTLLNPLRLPSAARKELATFDEKFAGVEEIDEQVALLGDLIILVAQDKPQAKRMLKVVAAGADADMMLMEIVDQYTKSQEVGEASPSES